MVLIRKDDPIASAPNTVEHHFQASVDGSSLAETVEVYVEEIAEVLSRYECIFMPYEDPIDRIYGRDTIFGLTDENWPLIMRELNESRKICDRIAREPFVRVFVEELLGRKLKPFVVNKIRINQPTLRKSQYSWHQDAATWPGLAKQFPVAKDAFVHTFWLSATSSNKGNGLGLLPQPLATFEHSFVENQGYFKTDVSNVSTEGVIEVYGPPYTAAVFGHKVMHRSLMGSSSARLSFDLRFFHV